MIGFKETEKLVLLAAGLILGHAAQAAGTVSPAGPNGNSYKPGATYGLGDMGPLDGKVYYVMILVSMAWKRKQPMRSIHCVGVTLLQRLALMAPVGIYR